MDNKTGQKRIDGLLEKYAEIFKPEVGCYRFGKLKLRLKPDAKPKFCKPRPIPFAFRELVDKELVWLEETGMISEVDYSPWGTPLVPVLKRDGSLRLCANYKVTVNKCLEDENYPLPRIEEVWECLQGGEQYTKLDLVSAYNQLELDEEAQLILAWSTHKGTYKVNRLPFGPKTAVTNFQRVLRQVLHGIDGVINFLDIFYSYSFPIDLRFICILFKIGVS